MLIFSMRVKSKLKELMKSRGLDSQLQLSKDTGVSPGAIGRMYRDQLRRIDVETVNKLSSYFQITDIADLLELVPDDE